jgi:sRNA-binding protein
MLLIHCPVTRTDELVADRRIRSVTNHSTHIAFAVACPCGNEHVVRTGRRWEEARARVLQRTAAQNAATTAAAAAGSAARAARVGVPA